MIELIEGGKTADFFSQKYANDYFQVIQNRKPDINPNYKNVIQKEVSEYFAHEEDQNDSLNHALSKLVYQRYTHEELTKLVAFYKTELGKKSLNTMPLLIADSNEVANIWGKSHEVAIREKIKNRLIKDELID